MPTPSLPEDLPARLRSALETLEEVAANQALLAVLTLEERTRLFAAAGSLYNPDIRMRRQACKELRRQRKSDRRQRDREASANTGIRVLRDKPVFITPNVLPPADFEFEDGTEEPEGQELLGRELCYICKRHYRELHSFYDQLCPQCGDFNYAKRAESADLRGRVALLTGGRVKIGYQAGIKLLRAGAHLVVTTRFPRDAAARYAAEPDFPEWQDRLEIFGLDLRHTPSVEAFCRHLEATRERLDFLVHNACQTVRRPPDFYRHMLERETSSEATLPSPARRLLGAWEGLRREAMLPAGPASGTGLAARGASPVVGFAHSAELSQIRLVDEDHEDLADLFPQGRLDQDLQQIDLRQHNSWRMLLHEVPTVELLETQLVNAIAPFVLNARLKALMLRTPERDKHIVNVSAMEGQFYRKFKTTRHPHTNMAKAALNMMTRTSAADYFNDGIHMNSVDTGWVSDEDPAALARRKADENDFSPPLDIVDGAARIVDPIVSGFNTGVHVWGQFLKDFKPTDW